MVELRDQSWRIQLGVVTLLGFGRRDVAKRPHQPAVVEPVDPFERRELNSLEGTPGPATVNQLGLVKTIDGFG